MSSRSKLTKFINDNIVAITVIPLLIGIHWTWLKLQDVPGLVAPEEKKELPIVTAAKFLEKSVVNELHLGGSKKDN